MPRRYVATPQGQIHVTEAGAGPALVLIGSAGRSARVFEGLVEPLAARFRVLAIDLPGCGNSDPLPPGAAMPMLAEGIVHVLDALGIAEAHFYGFQTGNKIGAALGARWPGRVRRLVLAGQSHSLVPDKAGRDEAIMGNVAHYFGEAGLSAEARLLRLWATGFRRISDIWWDNALFAAPDRAAALERARLATLDRVQNLPAAQATYAANFAYDLGADLRRLQAPVLFLEVATPAEDHGLGRQGAALLRLLPGARLVTWEEPDGPSHAVTLAARYPELAVLLAGFLLEE